MALTREQAFGRTVETTFYGAVAQTCFGEWYELLYRIRFRTGAVLENTDVDQLMQDAWTYYHATFKLTGEYP